MAATIPKRKQSRRIGPPWALGLLALLFIFWKFVGGPGGFLPGSGSGPDQKDLAASRPFGAEAAGRETTVRREVTKQLPHAAPASRAAESRTMLQAHVRVARSTDPARGEITIELARNGVAFSGLATLEVLPDGADSRGAAESRRDSQPMINGVATISGLRPGERRRVRIIPEGEPALAGSLSMDDGDRTLELTDRATITGRAAFSEGAPAGDQDVVAKIFCGTQPAEVIPFRTRPDGGIEIPAPSGHDILLELRPKGAIAGADIAPIVFHRDVLEPGSTWDLGPEAVTLEREAVLAEGTVQNREGWPVSNATVLVLPLNLPTRALAARSDAEGRFVVKGPPAMESFEVFASTENDAARLPTVEKGATGLKLVLAAAGSIRGRVASPAACLNPLLRVELQTERLNVFLTTHVLSDGTFEFPHVPAGRWSLAVAGPDEASGMGGIEVPEGGPSSDPRLQAVPVKTNFVMKRVRVIDRYGAPIVGARVEVVVGPTASLHPKTDGSGIAEILVPPELELPASELQLLIQVPGFAPYREFWDWKRTITLLPPHTGPAESR